MDDGSASSRSIRKGTLKTITRDELCAAIWDRIVTVVDALPPTPYRSRHIPGACNLVHEDVEAAAAVVVPDRHAPIVTYSTDASCGRGEALAERLEGIGYTNVRVYRDGIEDWVNAGLPIETGDHRRVRLGPA